MRILEVLDTYYPKFDGPTLVITSYAKSLNKIDGVQTEVCVPRFPKYEDKQPFHVFRVKSLKGPEGYYYGLPKFDRKLKKYLKENKFDVIHIHSPFTMCSFFAKYGKKHGIPTIFSFHTKFKEDFDRVLKLKTSRKIAMNYIMKNINRVDHVLTVSDGAGDCLREYGYKKKIKVIRNGTDLICPQNEKELKDEITKKYNLKDDEKVFLSVGRIVENKKLDFALDVMKVLKDNGVKFKYLIVGAGPYEETLKQKVQEMNLGNEIIFTGKIMDRTLLSAHYLRADLFIFPSTFDTASLSPIEAAAIHLPTIMTKGCSTAEIIIDEQNGLLADEDKNAWAKKIMKSIKEGTLKKLGKNAQKEVYKTWDQVANEVLEYYKKVIENHEKEA